MIRLPSRRRTAVKITPWRIDVKSFAMHCIKPMDRFNATCAFAAGLILMGVLTGCTTYRKCGFEGCPGDAKVTAEVSALLNQHPELEGANSLYVQTLDREVYLNGLVDTPFQRQTAESIALKTPGVAGVANMIAVSNER